jgi:hypothetical protein
MNTDLILLEHEGSVNMFEDKYEEKTQTHTFYATGMYGTGIITPKWFRMCFPS